MNPKTNAELLNVIAAKNNEIKRLEAASKSRAVDIVELRNEISNLRRWLDTDEELKAIIELAGKINKEFRGL